jgi:hypothetical protein
MKYLKRFNESDSWAGSLYAYHNPIPPSRGLDQVPIPNQEAHPYKCKDCDMEFYSLDGDIVCLNCGSTDYEDLTYGN